MRKIVALIGFFWGAVVMADGRVSVSGLQVGSIEGFSSIQGFARNNSDVTLTNVFVNFNLYNNAGNIIGSTIAHGRNIHPGESWRFSAPTPLVFNAAELTSVISY